MSSHREAPEISKDPVADNTWNRPQFYSVTRVARGHAPVLPKAGLTVPPVNIGPRSTADYEHFTAEAVHTLPGPGRRKVFAGQRAEGFHVDLDAIFDLGTLRTFQLQHLIASANAVSGVNGTQGLNLHSIAIQVPITDLTRNHTAPTDVMQAEAVIGVWASASRQKSRVFDSHSGRTRGHGPFVQVSRLGNPLFNEVIGPMGDKDRWNAVPPRGDDDFAKYVARPELAALVAGDPAGFPNGRRVADDVTTVELRAIAGLTIPLVDHTFTPDRAASAVTDDTTNTNSQYLNHFPYLGTPAGGFQTTPGTPHT
jgi:hypothetical protein